MQVLRTPPYKKQGTVDLGHELVKDNKPTGQKHRDGFINRRESQKHNKNG